MPQVGLGLRRGCFRRHCGRCGHRGRCGCRCCRRRRRPLYKPGACRRGIADDAHPGVPDGSARHAAICRCRPRRCRVGANADAVRAQGGIVGVVVVGVVVSRVGRRQRGRGRAAHAEAGPDAVAVRHPRRLAQRGGIVAGLVGLHQHRGLPGRRMPAEHHQRCAGAGHWRLNKPAPPPPRRQFPDGPSPPERRERAGALVAGRAWILRLRRRQQPHGAPRAAAFVFAGAAAAAAATRASRNHNNIIAAAAGPPVRDPVAHRDADDEQRFLLPLAVGRDAARRRRPRGQPAVRADADVCRCCIRVAAVIIIVAARRWWRDGRFRHAPCRRRR